MPALEQTGRLAADLYWLAFLLTGESALSVGAAAETIDRDVPKTRFFSGWMLAWSRKVVIARALASVRERLAASARRTASLRIGNAAVAPGRWSLDANTSKVHLERALLAIDILPRCALVLSIFEKLSVDDVSVLLDCSLSLVRKAQSVGAQELARNFVRMAPTSGAAGSGVWNSEAQYA
jgi:DNA-directed RNA polymerase specialized sigma24 family protein